MKLHRYDYRRETLGEELDEGELVRLLTGNERVLIYHDTEGFLGHDRNMAINYGDGGKRGFMSGDTEYWIDPKERAITVLDRAHGRRNMFYDADKRSSFDIYKVTDLGPIDEIVGLFKGYRMLVS